MAILGDIGARGGEQSRMVIETKERKCFRGDAAILKRGMFLNELCVICSSVRKKERAPNFLSNYITLHMCKHIYIYVVRDVHNFA